MGETVELRTVIARTAPPVGETRIHAGAANRDGRVFEEPDRFRFDRDPALNLLYGAGIHVCPGAPLARLEMRVFLEELLERTTVIELHPEKPPANATYPSSGFSKLPLRVRSSDSG